MKIREIGAIEKMWYEILNYHQQVVLAEQESSCLLAKTERVSVF